MTETVKIVSPVDGRVYAERPVASGAEIETAVAKAKAARQAWGEVTVRERAKFLNHFVDALLAKNDEIVPPRMAESLWKATGQQRIIWLNAGHYTAILYLISGLKNVVEHFGAE